MNKYAQTYVCTLKQERKVIFDSLTIKYVQFKKERADIKVAIIIETIDTESVQYVYVEKAKP